MSQSYHWIGLLVYSIFVDPQAVMHLWNGITAACNLANNTAKAQLIPNHLFGTLEGFGCLAERNEGS